MTLRPAEERDREAIWKILEPVVREGETFTLPRNLDKDETLAFWFSSGHAVFVAVHGDDVAGTYFLRANARGGGSHVANCGYATAKAARGRGIATAMCEHSLDEARKRGFRAMQFNFVVATNERAVALWRRLGFQDAGRLPGAFAHPAGGFVDALVMYREL